MKVYAYGTREGQALLNRWQSRGTDMADETLLAVKEIVSQVKARKDQALIELTKAYDGVTLSELKVPLKAFSEAEERLNDQIKKAIERAYERIKAFHDKQLPKDFSFESGGICSGVRHLPLRRAGIYVPGGKATYPSSVLMNAVPAVVAGVKEIVMVSPPNLQGTLCDEVLYAAKVCGIDQVFLCGGAQAIAALAYGTESIPKVDVITGPGNVYVSMAKKWVYGDVAVDMIAGPSEILILSDGKTPPDWLAADLLSQAEHDTLAAAVLVTTCMDEANAVAKALEVQLEALPKKEMAKEALDRYGGILVCDAVETLVEIANDLAPEHLEVLCEGISLESIVNAGCVFLGPYTPEPLGDYMAGPNHVLPTNGSARFASPLGVENFLKRSNYTQATKAGLENLSAQVIRLAESEGLIAHARAIERRFL